LEILDQFHPSEVLVPGLRLRTNAIIMPLLNVAQRLAEPESQRYRTELIEFATELDQQAAQANRTTVEGMLVGAYVDQLAISPTQPTCDIIAKAVHRVDDSVRRWLNSRKASEILRNLGFTTRHTKRGAEVNIDATRLQVLCQRFAISGQP